MEKQIKMSLEIARKFYKDDMAEHLKDWLLENFTKEELEGREGYTWEESFSGEGYECKERWTDEEFKNVKLTGRDLFKTKEQAESALAFAQLSHIVAKMNGGLNNNLKQYTIQRACEVNTKLIVEDLWDEKNRFLKGFHHLTFADKGDAETSLRVNRELWEKYWMVKKSFNQEMADAADYMIKLHKG